MISLTSALSRASFPFSHHQPILSLSSLHPLQSPQLIRCFTPAPFIPKKEPAPEVVIERTAKHIRNIEKVEHNKKEAMNLWNQEAMRFIREKNVDEVYEIVTKMRRQGVVPTKFLLDNAIRMFAAQGKYNKMRECIGFGWVDKIKVDEYTYMNAIREYAKIREYEWIIKTFLQMTEKISPSQTAYHEAIKFLAKEEHIGNMRKAEEVFYTTHRFAIKPFPKTCFLFIRLLVSSNYEGDVDRALDVIKYMREKRIAFEPISKGLMEVFMKHLRYLEPLNHKIRMKKVLVGMEFAGLPRRPFNRYWDMADTKWVKKIKRADLAHP